jgi:hypothetical protein
MDLCPVVTGCVRKDIPLPRVRLVHCDIFCDWEGEEITGTTKRICTPSLRCLQLSSRYRKENAAVFLESESIPWMTDPSVRCTGNTKIYFPKRWWSLQSFRRCRAMKFSPFGLPLGGCYCQSATILASPGVVRHVHDRGREFDFDTKNSCKLVFLFQSPISCAHVWSCSSRRCLSR